MTHSRRFAIAFILGSVASLTYARGNLKELTVPLKFTPQEGVHATSGDLPPALLNQAVEVRVEDARKLEDPLVIGQGTHGDDKLSPIHADHDVITFIQEVVTGVGNEWSLKQERSTTRILTLQVTRLFIDERDKAVGSILGSEVKLGFIIKHARCGPIYIGDP